MFSKSAAAVVAEPQSAATECDDLGSVPTGELSALLSELSADWSAVRTIADRRMSLRSQCCCTARLTSLDRPSVSGEVQPISVRLIDLSRRGVGLAHADPLPFRLVRIALDVSAGPAPILVVRLQWCRFRSPGVYESGGRIQRIIGAGS